jgi:hypothetical protein
MSDRILRYTLFALVGLVAVLLIVYTASINSDDGKSEADQRESIDSVKARMRKLQNPGENAEESNTITIGGTNLHDSIEVTFVNKDGEQIRKTTIPRNMK